MTALQRAGLVPGTAATNAARPDPLRTVRIGYCAAVVAAAIVQLAFFWREEDNLVATLLAAVSSVVGIAYALNAERFRFQPVSALILLFYTTTATAAALIVKSIEFSPVADRLTVPALTYGVMAATQLVLLVADQIYLRVGWLHRLRNAVSMRILVPLGVMRWPNDTQLWVLGLLGCASVILTGTDYESGASFGMASAGAKLLRAFGFLKFAPFLIPFRDALSGVPSRPRLPIVPLACYFVALVGISFATNSRSTFADAVPTVAICLLIAMAVGRIDFKRIPPARIALFAVGAVVAASLLSRVALAMVVVRDYRYSVDVDMLVRMTFEALFDSQWLDAAKSKMDASTYIGNYSEEYVNSRFAARFILTKFHDNMLYYFSLFGPDNVTAYREFMLDRVLGTLPDPLLRAFGIALDKSDLVVSNGDYVVYIVDGWGLGGFKTGSMVADTYAIFGWAFPLVLIACALMLFVFHDAFVVPGAPGRIVMSPMIILLIWNLVGTTAAFGLGAETVTAVPAGIVRGLPQNVLFFIIATVGVRMLTRLVGRG